MFHLLCFSDPPPSFPKKKLSDATKIVCTPFLFSQSGNLIVSPDTFVKELSYLTSYLGVFTEN